MATYTSNYGWTKPSGSDNVDISVLNDNLDDQDSTIHDAFLNMAPPFSESSTYAVDDIVLYGTGLYKCHTAVVTPGSWTGSTNWQVYKLSEGGGGGLTLGETSSTAYRGDRGKTAYDHSQATGNPHGTTKSDVGLGNVPNVSTNDQTPTFTEASTRNNIASGEKLSVILGKVQKFFNDLKTVAFSGSYNDLTNKPSIPTKTSDITNDSNFVSDANYVHTDNNFTTSEKTKLAGIASGAEANVQANWSQTNTSADDFIKNKPSLATVATSGSYADLSNKPTIPTTAGGISYDNTDSGLTATDVQGAVDELAESYPASKVMMSDGVTSVEEAVDDAAKKAKAATDITMTPNSGITIQSSRIMKMDKLVIAQLKIKWSTPNMNEYNIINFNGFDVSRDYAVGVVADSHTNTIGTFLLSNNRLYIKLSASEVTSATTICITIIGFTT